MPLPISVDTYKAEVARRALEAGAQMINDIWGLKHDPELALVAAERKVPLVIMHNQQGTSYDNLVPEVIASLRESIRLARGAGVAGENIIIDPGIGFGKTLEHNLELMRHLEEFRSLGRPILLGTSRKSMIGLVLNLPPDYRLEGTAATVALGIAKGVDMVRVHDVRYMARVCRMSDAIVRGASW
jgi:dihydropteroate synthase